MGVEEGGGIRGRGDRTRPLNHSSYVPTQTSTGLRSPSSTRHFSVVSRDAPVPSDSSCRTPPVSSGGTPKYPPDLYRSLFLPQALVTDLCLGDGYQSTQTDVVTPETSVRPLPRPARSPRGYGSSVPDRSRRDVGLFPSRQSVDSTSPLIFVFYVPLLSTPGRSASPHRWSSNRSLGLTGLRFQSSVCRDRTLGHV